MLEIFDFPHSSLIIPHSSLNFSLLPCCGIILTFLWRCAVLAKKTSKNQITLPKAIVERFPDVEYFDVREEQGRIVLFPVALNRADAVRDKLAEMGIVREDVADALDWARRK